MPYNSKVIRPIILLPERRGASFFCVTHLSPCAFVKPRVKLSVNSISLVPSDIFF